MSNKIEQTAYIVLTPKEYRKLFDKDFESAAKEVIEEMQKIGGNPLEPLMKMNSFYAQAYALFRTSTAYPAGELQKMHLQLKAVAEAVNRKKDGKIMLADEVES